MPNLEREVTETVKSLRIDFPKLTDFEALQIAVKIQQNRVLQDAFLVTPHGPVALEAIAMQLGAGDGSSIKDALYQLASREED